MSGAKESFECDVCRGSMSLERKFILKEINKLILTPITDQKFMSILLLLSEFALDSYSGLARSPFLGGCSFAVDSWFLLLPLSMGVLC